MKKIMKKIISILIAFTFLVNNVSFALSPGLKFNVLGQEVPYQEFLVLAEIGLQSDLQMLDSIVDIDGTHDVEVIREAFRKNERFKMKQTYRGDVKGNLTEVIAYFNLVQHSSGNMFTVPVSVEKGEQRKDYKLLFSTERDVDNGYPTTLYEVRDRQREKKDAEITGKIYDKRSIAITGITGELGKSFSRVLFKQGHRLTALVRERSRHKLGSTFGPVDIGKIKIEDGNLFSIKNLKAMISGCDVFYHFAGAVGRDLGERKEEHPAILATNGFVVGLMGRIIKDLKRDGDIRFVYPSSYVVASISDREDVKVWVNLAVKEFNGFIKTKTLSNNMENELVDFSKRFLEKTPIPDGVRPYTISKLLGEAFALKMKNSINIRIGNVYGPECHVHNRIYGLISNRMKDEQMEVFDEAIDCIYIEDATEILAKLSGELMPPRDFALVTGELTPLKALISSIKKITPESKGDFTFAGSRQETPLLENKASRQLLGRDFTPLSTGLSLTVNFYRAKMLAEKVPILEKLLYKFLSVESLRKVISCVDVSLTGDFNGNARIKKTINNINAIACAALRKNIANWEEFVAATKPVFSEIKKLNDILLSIDQDESVLKLSSMLYINFIKEFKIFAEGKAGEEAIDKILKYCNDEIDAMLIGVSLEYNVQKMKKWFIQKGYCVLVGESGIFKRIHFHEILENEEYEVNGEKFNYYFMKPFGNIHQSVRRSYAWSERGDNNIFVVLSDELKSTDKGIQGTLQGTPYYISEKLRKEFYENNFEKSVRDFKKMDNLSADIIREEFQGMDETKIIRCLVDDAKEHEKRHQSNKLLRIIGYGNEVQEHEETSAFFAEIANAKCPKYTLIKLISYCINYLSLSSSSLHGTAAWHVIFPELFPEIMKVSRVIENKDRLEEILNVVKNISADELRQRAERAHLKLFNRPTVEARKVNRLRENERSNIGQLIDKTITEISAGETPDWMAQNFQPGLETVDEEFKGDIATVRKRLPAKKKLSLATEDEEVLARVEQALDQLVVHPKAGELTWLQLEAVGDILLRRVTGNDDIYQEHKQQMDNTVNSLYQEIREKVIAIEGFDEAFREAMIYAGIVNLLDLSHIGGIGQVDEVMNDFAEFKRKIRDLHAKVNKDGVIVDELDTFLTRLKQQPDGRVLYFLDNHGEVILDQIVIELLLRVGYKVSVVARESVVRDDVTRDEAIEIFGNNAIFSEYLENNSLKIVTDGSYLLGADLTKTEKHSDFQTAWKESFIAISKGAGNRRSMFGQCLSMPMLFTQMMKKSSSGYRQIENVRGEEIGNRKDYDLLLAYQSSKGFDKPFEIARSLIPRQYRGNGINQETLTNALREAGCSQIDPVKMDEKTAFIFSEKAVFDNGLGILLPKLAKAGIKIAVIARNARERELIEKLNNTELAGEKNKIVCADSVMEATSLVKGVARFYYFKLENDPEESMPANVALIDSFVVKQIIEAIGKASGLDIGMIERLHEAARQFAIAA